MPPDCDAIRLSFDRYLSMDPSMWTSSSTCCSDQATRNQQPGNRPDFQTNTPSFSHSLTALQSGCHYSRCLTIRRVWVFNSMYPQCFTLSISGRSRSNFSTHILRLQRDATWRDLGRVMMMTDFVYEKPYCLVVAMFFILLGKTMECLIKFGIWIPNQES
jgi:hypothetical protein